MLQWPKVIKVPDKPQRLMGLAPRPFDVPVWIVWAPRLFLAYQLLYWRFLLQLLRLHGNVPVISCGPAWPLALLRGPNEVNDDGDGYDKYRYVSKFQAENAAVSHHYYEVGRPIPSSATPLKVDVQIWLTHGTLGNTVMWWPNHRNHEAGGKSVKADKEGPCRCFPGPCQGPSEHW